MRKSALEWLADLRDAKERVWQAATYKLGGLVAADAWMAPDLIAALGEPDEIKRFWAITALKGLARHGALRPHGAEACARVVALAQSDPRHTNRAMALGMLGKCPGHADATVPAMIEVIRTDADVHVRKEGVRALAMLAGSAPAAGGLLVALLEDAELAHEAAIALKFVPLSEPAHVEALVRAAASHANENVRSQLGTAIEMRGYRS